LGTPIQTSGFDSYDEPILTEPIVANKGGLQGGEKEKFSVKKEEEKKSLRKRKKRSKKKLSTSQMHRALQIGLSGTKKCLQRQLQQEK